MSPPQSDPTMQQSQDKAVAQSIPSSSRTAQDNSLNISSNLHILADDNELDTIEDERKTGQRRLFGLGRGKKDTGSEGNDKSLESSSHSMTPDPVLLKNPKITQTAQSPYMAQAPDRNLHSSSPRMVSPAGSQIFERDVQDSSVTGLPISPVPSHLQVDDHIPSVLDASSEAITNKELDPDHVEIVTHAMHHSAAHSVVAIAGNDSMSNSWVDDFVKQTSREDMISSYNTHDSTDIHRLSFISFADVVQSEHAEHQGVKDLAHVAGLTSFSSGYKSASPTRSPVSSGGFDTSPPTSNSASVKALDVSPTRGSKPLGSPTQTLPPSGELSIETMSQALKKTQEGELSCARPLMSFDGLSDRNLG